MLHKDVLTGGWQEEAVKESLDLCLSCKGCKGDCPVRVDVATYRAEFLSHYYEKRWRPRQACLFGRIDTWARLASMAPRFANLLSGAPVTSQIGKWFAGIAKERGIPKFANQTFTHWFRSRPRTASAGEPVLLWPDTFTNNYFPAAARAAVRVLEAGGYRVMLPERDVCCGRPLYEYGFLDTARERLRSIVEMLSTHIRLGTPLVVLEPTCGATFRDELRSFFPTDPLAKKLGNNTFFFDEFVERHYDRFGFGKLERNAIVHMHCNEKSLLQERPAERLATRLGMDCSVPEQGCCGMAGAFGFEEEKYPVSMRIAEMALLPAVRAADAGTLIIADGYSCREQIEQSAQRRSLHLAQVMEMALPPGFARLANRS
jgi:Fe-S oxidoreductase